MTYVATLWINGTVEAGQNISLNAGETKPVTFNVTRAAAGSYEVRLDRLFSSFDVTAAVPIPAAFEMSQLSVLPTEVNAGETVTISAVVTNTGQVEGSYTVTLKINGAVEATQAVTLTGGQTTTVTFEVARDVAGTYQVDVSGLTGSFAVKAPLPWWLWLIVGLVAAAIIGVVISWQLRRSRA